MEEKGTMLCSVCALLFSPVHVFKEPLAQKSELTQSLAVVRCLSTNLT